MKAILLPALLSFVLSTASPARSCREVVRDSSGRVVQTIDRQKQAGGSERAVIRDASGRVIGTATTRAAREAASTSLSVTPAATPPPNAMTPVADW